MCFNAILTSTPAGSWPAGSCLLAAWGLSIHSGIGSQLAWICAGLSAVGATLFALLKQQKTHSIGHIVASVGAYLGIVAGLTSAAVLAYQLAIRWLYLLIELATVTPSPPGSVPMLGHAGLLTIAMLGVSCLVALAATNDRRVVTGLVAIGAMLACWISGQNAVIESPISGGIRLAGATQTLSLGLTLILVVVAMVDRLVNYLKRWQLARYEPDSPADKVDKPAGLLIVCSTMAFVAIALGIYHICVPIGILPGDFRSNAWLGLLCSIAGAASLFMLTARYWSPVLADGALAFGILGLINLALTLAPTSAVTVAQRYPIVFTQILFGLAVAIAISTWLCKKGEQQLDRSAASTMASLLIPHTRRCVVSAGLMCLLVAGMMAVWPMMIAVNISDLSMARITAGLAANLLALLALLRGARQLKQLSMHVLVAGSLCTTVGFLVVRMLPFTPTFG